MAVKIVFNSETEQWEEIELTQEEANELTQNQASSNYYPDNTAVADRVTGIPHEVFVENGVLTSDPVGE